jgi:hypothetical protein
MMMKLGGPVLASAVVALSLAATGCIAAQEEPLAEEVESSADAVSAGGPVQLDANNVGYKYAPAAMFDEVDKVYKVWTCGTDTIYDRILYKQSPTLAGLNGVAWSTALAPGVVEHPGSGTTAFDYHHTCDPNVINRNGTFYMYYGGLNGTVGGPWNESTRIGLAVSSDRGKTFTRVSAAPIGDLGPCLKGAYCMGQPAVVFVSPYYYMVYTRGVDYTNLPLRLIKSTSPSFTSDTVIKDLDNFAYSVDLAYHADDNQFVVAYNMGQSASGNVKMKWIAHDLNWNQKQTTDINQYVGGSFGEGVAFLGDSTKRIRRSDPNYLTMVGASWGTRPPLQDWISGPMYAVKFTE